MTTSPLTAREGQIRALVVDGLTNEEIAARLDISSRTVEAHLRMLFRKLKVSRRDELAGLPARSGPDPAAAESDDKVIRRLEEQLAARKRQIDSYEAAMQLIIDRQFPLYDERVEIDITVGRHTGEDMVVERHWTTPMPYLVYRVIRPITPTAGTVDYPLDSVSPTCAVVGQDVGVAVRSVADKEGRPRLLILFQPGLTATTEWVLRYRTPGLWDPLREYHSDSLRWLAGTLDGLRPDGISDLTVHFRFPSEASTAGVAERRSLGTIEESRSEDGGRHFTFRDSTKAGGPYEWRLSMSL
jgi:DNA-binding CsgD family transcriptional regulator